MPNEKTVASTPVEMLTLCPPKDASLFRCEVTLRSRKPLAYLKMRNNPRFRLVWRGACNS